MSAGRGRRWTILLVAAALLPPAGAALQPWLAPSRSTLPIVDEQLVTPIVLVTVAGLRADHVRHLGYERETTPNLDRLAEQGISFTHAYANGNDELVSTACLLTAACPGRTNVHGGRDVLAGTFRTLAERCRSAGYATFAVVANPRLVERGFEQGFDVFVERPRAGAAAVLAEAGKLVRGSAAERWLLWIDLADLLPPYGGADTDPRQFLRDAPRSFGAQPGDYWLTPDDYAARGWGGRHASWLVARYDAALHEVDAALGRFLGALEAENRLETLYLCVAGTSGTRLDERNDLLFAHAVDLYEPSLRVPLLFRMPTQYVRGLLLDGPAMTVDVGPALAEMVLRRGWKGAIEPTLARIIEYQSRQVERRVFAEGSVRLADAAPWTGFVLRTPEAKVVLDREGQRAERFDLAADPREQEPLPLGEGQREYFVGELQRWLAECKW